MKFLFKLAIVIALAKIIAVQPVGVHPFVDALAQYTVRDLAVQINGAVNQVQAFVESRL